VQSVSASLPIENTASTGLVGEPDIVVPGCDAGDTQSLVEIHCAVRIIAALIGPPLRCASRRHAQMGDGLAGQVPEPGAAALRGLQRSDHRGGQQ
jgi:hypothetical protein